MIIPDEVKESIRERVDLGALIGEYVRLQKSGASLKGRCPFHDEKSPSFYVHPHRGFFKCFGCDAKGDVFSFLMRMEGLGFGEAARRLAERAGVELPTSDPREDEAYRRKRQRQERLLAITEAAAGFYRDQLGAHPLGEIARQAIAERGVLEATAETFRLGYAPHGWDGLTRFLERGGWSPREAEEVGLIVPRRGRSGHYDRFRHRLMFTITDHRGRIVAFSGRVLPPPPGEEEDAKGGKYINSPETPLYTKGEVLFGLHEGRVDIRRRGWVLLCEGNFDLLMLHQAGFANAVAPLGTALTPAQTALLRRSAERAVLLFDGDAAGRRAVRAAHPVLAKAGLPAKVVVLPPGDDPDSFLRREGPDALQQRVDGAPGIVEHLIEDAAASARDDAAGKAEAIAELGPVLALVTNAIERQLHLERVARAFDMRDVEAIKDQLRRGARDGRRRSRRAASQPAEAPAPAPKRRVGPKPPGIELAVVGAFLDAPELVPGHAAKFQTVLTSPDLRAILLGASRLVVERGRVEAAALLEMAEGNGAIGWLERRLAVQKYDAPQATALLDELMPRLELAARRRQARELRHAILEARNSGDHARMIALSRQRTAILRGDRPDTPVTETDDENPAAHPGEGRDRDGKQG